MSKTTELLTALVNDEQIEDFEPRSRMEAYLKNCCLACGCDGLPEPISETDKLLFALAEKVAGGGSGGGTSNPVIHALEVTENGTYEAPNGVDGYSPVTVNVAAGGGSGGSGVPEKDVNFYDYDGTCLYAYTVAEAQEMSELPALPEREGLICQGWNYDLDSIKSSNGKVTVGATYTTDDGTTRIYIHLEEGRTSPMLGVCPNGTVTVDWGDGTEPDTLTGTSTTGVQWTPNHEYAMPGDYLITLTVEGTMALYGTSSTNANAAILRQTAAGDSRNKVYQNAVRKIELGDGVTGIGIYALAECASLRSITIPNSVTSIGNQAFRRCRAIKFVVIPNSGKTELGGSVLYECSSLVSASFPCGIQTIPENSFYMCYSLSFFAIPNGVVIIGYNAFANCKALSSVTIPNSVATVGPTAFDETHALSYVLFPKSVTTINQNAFADCGAKVFDFTQHTEVPTISEVSAFSNTSSDREFRVPAALYDEWIAATNWATYASYIKAV